MTDEVARDATSTTGGLRQAIADNPATAALSLAAAYHSCNVEIINRIAEGLWTIGTQLRTIGSFDDRDEALYRQLGHAVKRIPVAPAQLDRACRRRAQALESILLPMVSEADHRSYSELVARVKKEGANP